jgi:glycosyltransferase involved in cell wall biosynthesis
MIKVLFDHQIFSMQRYGGISRYFANIHQTIAAQSSIQSEISVLKSNNYYIQQLPAPLNNLIGDLLLDKASKLRKWNKIYSEYKINKNDYDVLHPTYYNPYFLKHTNKDFVITVHDMIHELFPEYFEPDDLFVSYKRQCVENAAHIIAISEATKKDLIYVLGVDEERITVIPHGFSPQLTSTQSFETNGLQEDFLLFVGDRRGYKNFARFLTAVAPLLGKQSLKLLCVGGGVFLSAELELLHRLKILNYVQQISASDTKLAMLYRGAKAFVYPSLYEGFGLPILEAFQNDCPIVASDNSCFREIGGNAIHYFDPYNLHSMSVSIQQLVDSSELSNRLVNLGRNQLLKYTMSASMDKTINVYKNVYNRKY